MRSCLRSLLLLWALVVYAVPSLAQELVISSGEYPPWSGAQLPSQGYVNHVISEAFKREGITVRFVYYPWKRTLEMLRSGEVSASSFWFDDPVKAREFLYSDTLSEHREMLFHRKDTALPHWARLQDLSAFRFGATRGYTYTPLFWKLAASGVLKAEESADDETNLRKLLAGRIDIFPMDEFSGWQTLASNVFPLGSENLVTTDNQPFRVQYGHLLMRRTADSLLLMRRFNEGLALMRRDGTLDKFRFDLYRVHP